MMSSFKDMKESADDAAKKKELNPSQKSLGSEHAEEIDTQLLAQTMLQMPNPNMMPEDHGSEAAIEILEEHSDSQFCVHHGTEIVFFCESCEEPICRNCSKLGPHNNQLHRINNIEDAFKSRVEKLRESIQGNLLEKRDELLAQIHRIEYRIEEIKYVKSIIERDARGEYGGIIERLKSTEGQKVAVLQHEIGELQKDLDRINDLGNTFRSLSNDHKDPITFISRARQLYENIEFLVAKPFKQNIEVYPYDLPRELTDMRLQLQKASAQQALIDFKNEIIWKVMAQRKDDEDEIKRKMDEAAADEINEWARLTDKFSSELRKYQMICYYCGLAMDDKSINKKCTVNVRIPEDFIGYTLKTPDAKFHGNHRHFFAKPKADYVDLVNLAREQGTKNSRGQTPFLHFVEVQMTLVKKLCSERGIDLQAVFADHDKAGKGTINLIQFSYILTQIVGLSGNDSDQIRKFFDPKSRNIIEYNDLLKVLNDTSLVETLYQQELVEVDQS